MFLTLWLEPFNLELGCAKPLRELPAQRVTLERHFYLADFKKHSICTRMQNSTCRITPGIAVGLIALAFVYRLAAALWIPSLPNFSPVMAVAFCAGLALPAYLAFSLPLGCFFATDLLLNSHFGQPLVSPAMAGIYGCYALAVGAGLALRNRGALVLFSAVLANGLAFYLVSNTISWIGNVSYSQTFGGWIQSLTVGVPGFPPTWTFFRNSMVADFLFFGTFLLAAYAVKRYNAEGRMPVSAQVSVKA